MCELEQPLWESSGNSISSLITYIQQQPLGPLGMGMKLSPLCEEI